MTDEEFIFYWFLTFFIWNIYYLWIVPKRSAQFWGKRFKSEIGQEELVIIGNSIIEAVIERSSEAFEETLDEFKQSFFGSLGKNIQETKSVLKMANPEGDLLEKVTDQNPILGLILSKLQPQLGGLMGSDRSQEGFKKGL